MAHYHSLPLTSAKWEPCFKMTLNSTHKTEKLETKSKRHRYKKNQNTERWKPRFTERIGKNDN